MAEKLSNNSEKDIDQKLPSELSEIQAKSKSPETKQSNEQIESEIEQRKQESKEKVEKLSEKPETLSEKKKPEQAKEKLTDEAVEKQSKPDKQVRQEAFREEISSIRQHLSPANKTLSKVVHNPVVESVSQVLEETVFRPSFLLGAFVGAILIGGMLYMFAYIRGYEISGSEFVTGLIIGGLIGIILEAIRTFGAKLRKK